MTNADTKAWLDSAACDDECLDRLSGGRECKDRCDRWLKACAAVSPADRRLARQLCRTTFLERRRRAL